MLDEIKELAQTYLKELREIDSARAKRIQQRLDEDKEKNRTDAVSIINAFEKEKNYKTSMLFSSPKKQNQDSSQNFKEKCNEFIEKAKKLWRESLGPNIFDKLPNDILNHIFVNLDNNENRYRLALTCYRFANFFRNIPGTIATLKFKTELLSNWLKNKAVTIPALPNGEIVDINKDEIFTANTETKKFISKLKLPSDINLSCLSILPNSETIIVGTSTDTVSLGKKGGELLIITDFNNKCNIVSIKEAHRSSIHKIVFVNKECFASISTEGKNIRVWDLTGNNSKEIKSRFKFHSIFPLSEGLLYGVPSSEKDSDDYIIDIDQGTINPADISYYLWTFNFLEITHVEKLSHIITENLIGGGPEEISCQVKLTDKHVIQGCKDSTLRIINIKTGEIEKNLAAKHTTAILGIIRVGENLIATCAKEDNTIHIVNIDTDKCVQTLTGHEKPIKILTLLPNGQLASADSNYIHVWDLTKPRKLLASVPVPKNDNVNNNNSNTTNYQP